MTWKHNEAQNEGYSVGMWSPTHSDPHIGRFIQRHIDSRLNVKKVLCIIHIEGALMEKVGGIRLIPFTRNTYGTGQLLMHLCALFLSGCEKYMRTMYSHTKPMQKSMGVLRNVAFLSRKGYFLHLALNGSFSSQVE